MKRFFTVLGTIAIVVLAVGSCGAPARAAADPAQTRAVAALERVGGQFLPPNPFFTRWSVVNFDEGSPVTDADLIHFAPLQAGVRVLSLDDTPITDAGLAHLAGMDRLKALSLAHLPLTDAGLAHLAGMSGLQELDLRGTPITDAGLDHLKGLKRLRKLEVGGTGITDAGLAHLRRSLPWCRIRRDGAPRAPRTARL